jgi:WD40 repeat protein
MQSLVWSNKSLNKSTVNLDLVIVINTVTSLKFTESDYSIAFHFSDEQVTYWHYDNQYLRDQDYNQLLATYCKDITQ